MTITRPTFESTFESNTANLARIRAFIREAGDGIAPTLLDEIELAVDEACSNIIEHAYEGRQDERIRLLVEVGLNAYRVWLSDWGKAFEPGDNPIDPSQLTSFNTGGRGLFLIRTLIDEVSYRIHPGGQNELHLVKYLG